MKTEKISIDSLQVNKANPRSIKDGKFDRLVNSLLAFPRMLQIRPIVANGDGTVLGGNMRLRALMAIAGMSAEELRSRILGLSDVKRLTVAEQEELVNYWLAWLNEKPRPVDVINVNRLSDEEKRQFVIKDNAAFGSWDWDALANEWDTEELTEWGVDIPNWEIQDGESGQGDGEIEEGDDAQSNKYTRKVEIPTYEPSDDCPPLSECTDTSRRDALLREINDDASLPADVRTFLRDAAQRHIVFKYAKIADYYAHASASVQRLMERSALVIIDIDKAIEGGFVTMTHDLETILKESGDDRELD